MVDTGTDDDNDEFVSDIDLNEEKETSEYDLEHQIYKPRGKARAEIEIKLELMKLEKETGAFCDKEVLY